jgi:hypothetical protein
LFYIAVHLEQYKNSKKMENLTTKEKELFLQWSFVYTVAEYEKKVSEYLKAKKEIENSLEK